MITKLIVPVTDTESSNFNYDGNLSNKDCEEMFLRHFNDTNSKVDAFVHGQRDNRIQGNYGVQNDTYHELNEDIEKEIDVLLLDSNRNDLYEETLLDRVDDGRMFVLIVNVNPETLDGDAESEIRYWIDDSIGVWEDDSLDKKTKLLSSPPRDLKIVLSDGHKYTLSNCKLFEDYSDDRFPLYFAMIVEKIIE